MDGLWEAPEYPLKTERKPFLSLPQDIRFEIYEWVGRGQRLKHLDDPPRRCSRSLAVLLTCKQIRHEALGPLLNKMHIYLFSDQFIEQFRKKPPKFARSAAENLVRRDLRLIGHIHISFSRMQLPQSYFNLKLRHLGSITVMDKCDTPFEILVTGKQREEVMRELRYDVKDMSSLAAPYWNFHDRYSSFIMQQYLDTDPMDASLMATQIRRQERMWDYAERTLTIRQRLARYRAVAHANNVQLFASFCITHHDPSSITFPPERERIWDRIVRTIKRCDGDRTEQNKGGWIGKNWHYKMLYNVVTEELTGEALLAA